MLNSKFACLENANLNQPACSGDEKSARRAAIVSSSESRESARVRARRGSVRSAIVASGLLVAATVLGTPLRALAATTLIQRVEAALRANRNLNGASAYTASPGVVVLFGKVFDDNDRTLAETTARNVPGVNQVINTLRTATGQWIEEEERINDTLQLNDLQDVSVRVVGPKAYLSGQVSSEAEQQRAVRVVSSISKLQVVNFTRVVPGPMFSTPNFF